MSWNKFWFDQRFSGCEKILDDIVAGIDVERCGEVIVGASNCAIAWNNAFCDKVIELFDNFDCCDDGKDDDDDDCEDKSNWWRNLFACTRPGAGESNESREDNKPFIMTCGDEKRLEWCDVYVIRGVKMWVKNWRTVSNEISRVGGGSEGFGEFEVFEGEEGEGGWDEDWLEMMECL